MSPFEPKTDGGDFELATSERPAQAGGINTTPAADITIRLWRGDPTSSASALTWDTESVLVYMIADLVAASHGRTASETPSAMTAHFGNTNHALVAARRIQISILEFVTCKPGDYLGAAVLIHPPVEAGFSSGMAQSALRVTEPGQIILSDGVSRSLKDLSGIDLRPVAALTTGGTEHAGLSELLWASQEQIAKVREAASARPTGVSASSNVGATMIVNAPIAADRLDSSSNNAATAKQKITRRLVDDGIAPTRDGAFEAGLSEYQQGRSFITRTRVIVGVVAILVIGVGVAMFYPSGPSKVPQRPPETQPVETLTAPNRAPQPVQPQPTPPVPQAPDAHAKVQPPVNKQPVSKQPKAKVVIEQVQDQDKTKKAADTPIQGFEGNSTYDGMTQKDIPRLLQWARSDAGNGRYEKAGQEYRVILQLEPNNPDAKEGLRKLQLAQQRER
jgi:hypothetical protein